jgi:hypothetical protein
LTGRICRNKFVQVDKLEKVPFVQHFREKFDRFVLHQQRFNLIEFSFKNFGKQKDLPENLENIEKYISFYGSNSTCQIVP